jgi:hypothetical protein
VFSDGYTVAGRAIGFALEQPLHVVVLSCSVIVKLKQLEYSTQITQIYFDVRRINKKNLRTSFFNLRYTEAGMGGRLRP